jgi:hypothetical protein
MFFNQFSVLVYFILAICIYDICAIETVNAPYVQCAFSKHKENRVLHILTCDTRSGYKEYRALRCT